VNKSCRSLGSVLGQGKGNIVCTRGTIIEVIDDPEDRLPEIFGGRVTLYTGGGRDSYLLVPAILEKGQ
jgi:hypothetical protein